MTIPLCLARGNSILLLRARSRDDKTNFIPNRRLKIVPVYERLKTVPIYKIITNNTLASFRARARPPLKLRALSPETLNSQSIIVTAMFRPV